jgi:outer membrane protein OmpA-like peptidoglycan-associated protein
MVLMSCGYAKKDEIEAKLADQKMDTDQKFQLTQDALAAADAKADNALKTARTEIGKAKGEAIAAAEEKDSAAMASMKSSMEAGDMAVKRSAEDAAAKALADAKAAAIAEDEKVRQAAKAAADKAMGAAEEADRKAAKAAMEAELAKELPKPKKPTIFTVYFGLGQTSLSKESMAELDKVASAIKSCPNPMVRIEGHTDNVPVVKSGYMNNTQLSQARAKAVKDHLVGKLGVPAETIKETVGLAFYKPAANTNKMNRRVEVIVIEQ